jgi:Cu-processing system permease protein
VNTQAVAVIAAKEMRDARHNRWFLLDAAAFLLLALGLSYLGLTGNKMQGMAGFGRTSAALVNLVLLIVPLMGLSIGALSMAAERERGTLATLLTQPMTRLELLVGKWCGLAAALAAAILVGFGVPGMMIGFAGSTEDAGAYVALTGLSLLVGLAGLGLGMLISCAVRTTAVAIGSAIAVWLVLVFFGDLGLLGIGLGMRLDAAQLLAVALVNPLTDFRIAAITTAGASPETLGPAGLLLFSTLGVWTVPALAAILAAWSGLPLAAAYRLLRKADVS